MLELPDAHFGNAQKPLPDWRDTPGDDPDVDDDEVATPKDVIAMLGFDPADEKHGQTDASSGA